MTGPVGVEALVCDLDDVLAVAGDVDGLVDAVCTRIMRHMHTRSDIDNVVQLIQARARIRKIRECALRHHPHRNGDCEH